jgi:Protein of unknown function (DUF1353)
MKLSIILLFLIYACATAFAPVAAQPVAGSSRPICKPHFLGELTGKFNDDGRTFTLSAPYGFVDATCTIWQVPQNAIVDGASIPRLLWTLVGGPFEGKYRNASVIHDWFCDRRTRTWASVHNMFHDAMIAAGVDQRQASIMYYGVYLGGPRWSIATIFNNRLKARGCRGCASHDSQTDNDSFAMKSDVRVRQVVFSHNAVELNEKDLKDFMSTLNEDSSISTSQIETYADKIHPRNQICPSGLSLNTTSPICQ